MQDKPIPRFVVTRSEHQGMGTKFSIQDRWTKGVVMTADADWADTLSSLCAERNRAFEDGLFEITHGLEHDLFATKVGPKVSVLVTCTDDQLRATVLNHLMPLLVGIPANYEVNSDAT